MTEIVPRRFSNETRHYRSIFISDLHLGTKGCQATRLLEFLNTHTCDHLYLVGDIIDGWQLKSNFYWPQSHTNVVREVLTRLKHDTVVTFVAGNHDEFLRKYTNMEFGNLRLVDNAVHVTADGRRLLVIHGDQFDVVTRYHRWVAILGDMSYNMLLQLNRWCNWWRERLGYGNWSLSAWVKKKVKSAVNFISQYEDAVAHECRRSGFDGVICGHIHHAERRRFQEVEYFNCGDWVESCTALLEDERGYIAIYSDSAEPAEVTEIKHRSAGEIDDDREIANGGKEEVFG